MVKRILFVIFSCCIFFISCNKKRQNIPDVTCDTLKCSDYTPDDNTPIYNDIKIVQLETNDYCLLNEINQIEVNDFFIFILDIDRRLFVFDVNGKFISQIGRHGQAPGEYLDMSTFYIENTNVIIIDAAKSSLIRYDFNGKYLFSEKFPQDYFQMSRQSIHTDDDKLLLYHGINGVGGNNMAYSLIDLIKNKMEQYFSYNPIKLNNYVYFYSNHPMTKLANEIDVILPLCDTVFCYSNSMFFPKYCVEIPGKMASRNQIDKNTTSYTQNIIALGQQGFFTGFTAIFETNDHILLEYNDKGIILGYFLCNKTTKQGKYYLYSTNEEMQQIPFFRIMGSVNDAFIGVAQPDALLQINWKVSGEKGLQFEKVISSLREDDNPVLFFYRIEE